MPERQKGSSYISNKFKLFVVGLIFFLIFLHLYAITTFPRTKIVPEQTLLSIVLALIGYLWIQELRDRHRLQALNRALVEAQSQLQDAEVGIITALILSEEAKDPYVRGHSARVTEYSVAIAREMGFSGEKQKIIERAGMLHDLGKLGIVDDILKKPDKLNPEEWEIVKGHPQRAVEILKPLGFLSTEKDIILHHHERYEGGGYPDGLKGGEIPLESRIIAVADTFDAMNSERAYRQPLAKDIIFSELKKASGSQLDPVVLTAFLNLLEKEPRLWKID